MNWIREGYIITLHEIEIYWRDKIGWREWDKKVGDKFNKKGLSYEGGSLVNTYTFISQILAEHWGYLADCYGLERFESILKNHLSEERHKWYEENGLSYVINNDDEGGIEERFLKSLEVQNMLEIDNDYTLTSLLVRKFLSEKGASTEKFIVLLDN